VAQDQSGAVFFTEGSSLLRATGVPTGGQAGWSVVSSNALVASDGSIWYLGTAAVDSAGDYPIYHLSNGQVTQQVCVTSATIGSKWLGMGGPTSALGLPTGDGSFDGADPATQVHCQRFAGGLIYSSAATGAIDVEYQLPADAQSLFSPAYLAIRANLLKYFFWNGYIAENAQWDSNTGQLQSVNFGDSLIKMGDALLSFAQEAASLQGAGKNPAPAENVLRIILAAIDRLDHEAQLEHYGQQDPGLFLRDFVGAAILTNGQRSVVFHRQGIPDRVNIPRKDFGSDSYTDAVFSPDQFSELLSGWLAVTRYSTSSVNRGEAVAQTRRLMSYCMEHGYNIVPVQGHAIDPTRAPGSFAQEAGFLSKAADLITGDGYFSRLDNVAGVEIPNQTIINDIMPVVRLTVASFTSGLSEAARALFNWDPVADVQHALEQRLNPAGTSVIGLPVSFIHEIVLSAASNWLVSFLGQTAFTQTVSLSSLLAAAVNYYLPGGGTALRDLLSQVSFNVPTGVHTVWQGIDSHLEITVQSISLEGLFDQISVHVPFHPSPVPYQKKVALTQMAFDPDPRIAGLVYDLAMNTADPQARDVWAVLLQSTIQPSRGVPPEVATTARSYLAAMPQTGPAGAGGAPAGWNTKDRWETGAVADGSSPDTHFNGLDFLSLETMMRTLGVY
jgi:hypothetical protein